MSWLHGKILVGREVGLRDEHLQSIRQAASGAEVVLCDREGVRALWGEAEVIASMDWGIPADSIGTPGRLRWIHLFHAGAEKILSPALVASPVVLTCTKGAHAVPIAEHAMAFLLAHAKELPRHQRQQMQRLWDRRPLGELCGKTLCIVGLGNIGQEIARLASCFGMRVVGARRSGQPVANVERVVPPDLLPEVLAEADYVVLSLPYTPATDGFIGARELAQPKAGAFLVNVCRGRVVNQEALLAALKEGRLGGAALDATEPEPLPPDSELWDLPNVIITPHNSGMSCRVRGRGVGMFCANMRRYLQGLPLQQLVDKTAGY